MAEGREKPCEMGYVLDCPLPGPPKLLVIERMGQRRGGTVHSSSNPASSGESVGTAGFLENGGQNNRIGKPHCFNGFRAALNMLRPAFGTRNRPWISRWQRFSSHRPFLG